MTTVRHEVSAHRLRIAGSCQTIDLPTVQDALDTFAPLVDGHLIVDLTAVTAIDQGVADELVAAAHRSRGADGSVTFVRKHGTRVHDALSLAEQAVHQG